MANLQQRIQDEIKQFLFLCPVDDAKILVGKYEKENMSDYVRLGCLALTFGYKLMFMKISQTVEKDAKEFISGLDILNGNIALLDTWVNNFIAKVRDAGAQMFCRALWEVRKTEIDKPDFTVKSLL